MTPALVGVALLALMAAIVTPLMLAAYRRSRVEWLGVPHRPYRWHSIEGSTVKAEQVGAAVDAALLALHPCFAPTTLMRAAERVHVSVQRVAAWHSPQHGVEVAGITAGYVLVVGSDLASLCHELAHLCEELEGQGHDTAHGTWGPRGIDAACDKYDAWRFTHEFSPR